MTLLFTLLTRREVARKDFSEMGRRWRFGLSCWKWLGLALSVLVAGWGLSACEARPAPPTVTSAAPATPTGGISRPPSPVRGAFDPGSVSDIVLTDYPVLPQIDAQMQAQLRLIYQTGLAAGNNPHVFSKLGDCMTATPHFLAPLSSGQYDLGEYGYLQTVLEHFAGWPARSDGWTQDSLATAGLATAPGFNVAGPLDPSWADPQWCRPGESPLACEYRVGRPSMAVIMFGTNDVTYVAADTYNFYLRTLIDQTLDHHILPILSTFPVRPEDEAKSLLLNQIVIRVADDYGVPLLNLTAALEPLPNRGVNPADTIHLTVPADGRVDIFDAEHLRAGFTMRNLVTLQALYVVLQAVR